MSGDWDWSIDTCIVQRAQMELAVYSNSYGQIVVRERADWPHDEEDKWIVIGRENALEVAKAILAEAGLEILSVCYADGGKADTPARKDTPGASRQRRYRQRHRNNGGDAQSVTRHGGRNGQGGGDLLDGVTDG